jgi:hypothetical protein
MRVVEDAKFSLIVRFQCSGRATDLTGSAAGAPAFVEPGPAEEKSDENKHGFTSYDMNRPYVISNERNLIHGPMSQKVSR